MPTRPRSGAVLFAKDLPRLAAFYQTLLAARVAHDGDGHVVLETDDLELVIHAIPQHIARTFEIATPPERREESAVKLFFPVDSLADARRTAAALGGLLDAPGREWAARGFRACDGHDPEGNVIQLRERAL